jgi:hypothetical protein
LLASRADDARLLGELFDRELEERDLVALDRLFFA